MANIAVTYGSNWYVTTGGALPLPYQLWPKAGSLNLSLPFLFKRMMWISAGALAGHSCTITDNAGNPIVHWIASGAQFMPPLEWERKRDELAPIGAIITAFDSGELFVYL